MSNVTLRPPEPPAPWQRHVLSSWGMALMTASRSLRAHRLRSALTMMAVLVGMFSIIVTTTATDAMRADVDRQAIQFSSHTIEVFHRPPVSADETGNRRRGFDYPLIAELLARMRRAVHAGAQLALSAGEVSTHHKRSGPGVPLLGVTPGVFACRAWTLESGRPIAPADVEGHAAVCVLGQELADKLFPNVSALQERVQFDGALYTVVGVLEPKGAVFGQSQDNLMVIPLTTGLQRYGSRRDVSLLVEAGGESEFAEAVEETRGLLRTLRQMDPFVPDDFEIQSNAVLREQFRALGGKLRAGALVVSAIALVAAGIGIFNVMLVSVTQRTREIGVRVAVGARSRDILLQFLIEAVLLCQVGGVAGILLGILAGNLGAAWLGVRPVLSLAPALLGLLGCTVVGLAAGVYPAARAARVDPVESLSS